MSNVERMKREASFWQQLRATVIRNALRKMRRKLATIRELLTPLYFLCIIVVIKLIIPEPFFEAETSPGTLVPLMDPVPLAVAANSSSLVLVAPSTSSVQTFIDSTLAVNTIIAAVGVNFEFVEDESELERRRESEEGRILAGIIFNEDPNEKLDYKIRLAARPPFTLPPSSTSLTPMSQCRQRESNSSNTFDPVCPSTSYFYSGFATLQALIETSWIEMRSGSAGPWSDIDAYLSFLPKNSYLDNNTLVMRAIIPLYLIMALGQFMPPMLTVIVDEKEKKIKESMKMVGLRDSVFWLSWFIIYSLMFLILSIIASLILSLIVVPSIDGFVVFLLLSAYGASLIMFAFCVTALFSKAKAAATAGSTAVLFLALLYYLQVFLEDSPLFVFAILCLSSPTAVALAIDKLLRLDLEEQSLDWFASDNDLSLAFILCMLVLDTVLYALLAMWLDQVLPTEYGTRQSPLFCLNPSFWCGRSHKDAEERGQSSSSTASLSDAAFYSSPDIEKVSSSMRGKESIVMHNLKKTFKKFNKPSVEAVKDISLKVYPNEITAILGHNGAGKTTLFNMLSGMTAPTSGDAHIFGLSINSAEDMHEIRKISGVCPQHDVLFDELSCDEHLTFFARIRGVPDSEVGAEVTSILNDVDLVDQRDTPAEKLSGGQKRKLSVGIALIGDPKLIFLDEPTAGVDPYSRRHLWSLLKQKKAGKVVLLTTHFMDEADVLADRKAIVSQGELRCYGSSLFLKNKFGVGYHLTIVLEANADLDGVRFLVKSTIEDAKESRLFGRELSFVLPRNESEKFALLFERLESSISEGRLGISSYGVSMTTLEEIFLKLGEEDDEKKAMEEENSRTNTANTINSTVINNTGNGATNGNNQTFNNEASMDDSIIINDDDDEDDDENAFERTLDIKKSWWAQFKALLYVRAIRKFREPLMLIVQVILPIVYIVVGLTFTSNDANAPRLQSPLNVSNVFNELNVFDTALTYLADNNDLDGPMDTLDVSKQKLGDDTDFEDLLQTQQAVNIDFRFGDFLSENRNKGDLRLLVNFTVAHSIPGLINALSNVFAANIGLESISAESEPFFTPEMPGFDVSSFSGAIFIGFCYTLIPLAFSLELIEDREIQAKNLLRVNGVSFGLYYGSMFTLLGLMMMAQTIVLLALIQIFDLTSLSLPPAFLLIGVLYLLLIFPLLLCCATISFIFDTVETGQNIFSAASFFGFLPYIAVSVLDATQTEILDYKAGSALHVITSFISPFYIPFGIIHQLNRQYLLSFCALTDTCDSLTLSDYLEPFETQVLFIALIFHLVFWFIGLRVVEVIKVGGSIIDAFLICRSIEDSGRSSTTKASPTTSAFRRPSYNMNSGDSKMDSDVLEERHFVDNYMADNNEYSDNIEHSRVLAVQRLHKVYNEGSKKKVAVEDVSLSVKEGEVFGLLGHNGAGKTTTMKMITAEEAPTRGKVRILRHEIKSTLSEGFENLGYCPQFDALWKTISVSEHLHLYAVLRGVPSSYISSLKKGFMDGLRISEYSDRKTKECSGGTKRKLSYALAMLGDPKIVLLDEPSTGMDPVSKRFVWNTILKSFKLNRGAILTTHSMEEADALCSRVAIMVKGKLRCLGSTQHLKNKYGSGYLMEIKMRNGENDAWSELEAAIHQVFEQATLNEEFEDRRIYAIPQNSVTSLADAFRFLENLKSNFEVEEYSFGQSTLEQVFIAFAKEQEEADETNGDAGNSNNGIIERMVNRRRSSNNTNVKTNSIGFYP